MKKCIIIIMMIIASEFLLGKQNNQENKVQFKYSELVKIFDYGQEAPLEVKIESVISEENAEIQDITYKSPNGGKVPAYIIIPVERKPPCDGVVFLHWGQGNRSEFIEEAKKLAEFGVVSISIDAPWHRPDFEYTGSDNLHIQTVLDLRRAVDVLESRKDIDKTRIGYVGHSFGATWGATLCGVEKRIKTFILMAGYATPSKYYSQNAPNPRLDGIYYMKHAAPSSLFFQFAENDEFVSKEASDEFFYAGSEPKIQKWYKSNHQFNEKAKKDRLNWLLEQLNLK